MWRLSESLLHTAASQKSPDPDKWSGFRSDTKRQELGSPGRQIVAFFLCLPTIKAACIAEICVKCRLVLVPNPFLQVLLVPKPQPRVKMKHRATKRVSTQSILYFPPPPGSLSPAEKTKKNQTQSHFKTVYKGDFKSKRANTI